VAGRSEGDRKWPVSSSDCRAKQIIGQNTFDTGKLFGRRSPSVPLPSPHSPLVLAVVSPAEGKLNRIRS
jgi:hypothetical protein